MKNRSYICALLFIILLVNYCQSQNKKDVNRLPHKVEVKFDSLYPRAANVHWEERTMNSTNHEVNFDCNCTEGIGHLAITFDTNGNIVNKNIFVSKNDLPATCTSYIENNYPNGFKYGNIIKIVTNNGETSYRVEMLQTNPDGEPPSGSWIHILKFKASGEFISLEKQWESN